MAVKPLSAYERNKKANAAVIVARQMIAPGGPGPVPAFQVDCYEGGCVVTVEVYVSDEQLEKEAKR